jgi:hypothetical protein
MREALGSNEEDAETVLTHFVGEMSAEDLDRLRAVVARRGDGPTGR